MERPITRRDFINGVAVAITGASAAYRNLEALASQAPASSDLNYPPLRQGLRGNTPSAVDIFNPITAGKYAQFTIVQWLMVLTTFFLIIVIFNVYSIQSAVWDWIPDIRDESIPFVFGALELFLNHALFLSMSLWFVGLAAISALGAIGTVHLVLRAREESENAELLRLLKDHHYLFILYYVVAAAIALLFAYICFALNLSSNDGVQGARGLLAIVLVLLIAVGLDGSAFVSNRYWRKAVIYARTGRMPHA